MVVDRIENWRYHAALPRLRRAFELLVSPAAAGWPDGRLELESADIIAMPQRYMSRAEGRWEAHRRYIDIQYILEGCERMGYAPVETLTVAGDFDVAADVGFFTGRGDQLRVSAGMFAIFYPHDAHMPCLVADERPEQVRKIVMKVRAD